MRFKACIWTVIRSLLLFSKRKSTYFHWESALVTVVENLFIDLYFTYFIMAGRVVVNPQPSASCWQGFERKAWEVTSMAVLEDINSNQLIVLCSLLYHFTFTINCLCFLVKKKVMYGEQKTNLPRANNYCLYNRSILCVSVAHQ